MGSNPISPNLIFLRPGTVLSVGHMHPIMNEHQEDDSNLADPIRYLGTSHFLDLPSPSLASNLNGWIISASGPATARMPEKAEFRDQTTNLSSISMLYLFMEQALSCLFRVTRQPCGDECAGGCDIPHERPRTHFSGTATVSVGLLVLVCSRLETWVVRTS